MDFGTVELEKKLYLNKTTNLVYIKHKDFREQLKGLYNAPEDYKKAIATILNAIYTCGLPAFTISRRTFEELIKNDNNLNNKIKTRKLSLNSDKLRTLFKKVCVIFESSTDWEIIEQQKKYRPRLVCLLNEEILVSMGEEMMKKLAVNFRNQAISIYQENSKTEESNNKKQQETDPDDLSEEAISDIFAAL